MRNQRRRASNQLHSCLFPQLVSFSLNMRRTVSCAFVSSSSGIYQTYQFEYCLSTISLSALTAAGDCCTMRTRQYIVKQLQLSSLTLIATQSSILGQAACWRSRSNQFHSYTFDLYPLPISRGSREQGENEKFM
ncbi:hypothetical protein RRG08_018035 [Elysia crispata]|uniref:Uncharacterized protein n=1 Tax=Elysia crispata TaxID=231223 RepID=A0AAE0ZD04_9GAST|nr:hypothetical protein RRG08_018035 [Elysia crispata]